MQHSYIDKYASLDSFIHRSNPLIKIVVSFVLILLIAVTDPKVYLFFYLYGLILIFLLLCSRIPLFFVFKKTLIMVPFVILVALFLPFMKGREGVILFRGIIIKSYLSILSMILLISSTKFTSLLKGLNRLKVPNIFIMVMSFMYRYLFLLIDELQRMQRAKESRSLGKFRRFHTIRVLSNIIGVLFVRSYERAERVYLAMRSRGFDGDIRTLD